MEEYDPTNIAMMAAIAKAAGGGGGGTSANVITLNANFVDSGNKIEISDERCPDISTLEALVSTPNTIVCLRVSDSTWHDYRLYFCKSEPQLFGSGSTTTFCGVPTISSSNGISFQWVNYTSSLSATVNKYKIALS